MGILEIIVILVVALIVIPPEKLPEVMSAAGKILRELRLASNLVVRELGGALDPATDEHPAPPINTMKPVAGASRHDSMTAAEPAGPSATPAAPEPARTPVEPGASS